MFSIEAEREKTHLNKAWPQSSGDWQPSQLSVWKSSYLPPTQPMLLQSILRAGSDKRGFLDEIVPGLCINTFPSDPQLLWDQFLHQQCHSEGGPVNGDGRPSCLEQPCHLRRVRVQQLCSRGTTTHSFTHSVILKINQLSLWLPCSLSVLCTV